MLGARPVVSRPRVPDAYAKGLDRKFLARKITCYERVWAVLGGTEAVPDAGRRNFLVHFSAFPGYFTATLGYPKRVFGAIEKPSSTGKIRIGPIPTIFGNQRLARVFAFLLGKTGMPGA